MTATIDYEQIASLSVDEYEEAGKDYARLSARELELENDRPIVKRQAILRLMGSENPLTTTADKPKLHSASSAEAIVESDPEYMAHLGAQRTVVFEKNMAYTRMTSARLRTELAIGALKAQAGVR
jgi:hypothetical protein